MAPQYIFTMSNLVKTINGEKILDNINLCFFPGAKIGVVGDNGSGKSTLLKIMAGIDQDFMGHAEPNKGARVGYVAQDPILELDKTVFENVETAFAPIKKLIDEYNQIAEDMGTMDSDEMDKAIEKMGTLQEKIDQVDGWNIDHMIEVASDALLLPDSEMIVRSLSGGERKRVALCKALLEKPDILLLDEPTNHLDAETVQWLEKQLQEFEGTVIIVTHDRYFLDNITKWILELDGGKGIPYEGNYSSWLVQKIDRLEKNERKDNFKQLTLIRELDWMRKKQEERRIESQAHVKDYLKRLETSAKDTRAGIVIEEGERLGDFVLEFDNISKSYGENELVKDFTFSLSAGSIVGVIGPNGIGKTTLFEMITENVKPDLGTVKLGQTVRLSYIDQHRDNLELKKTLFEDVCDGMDFITIGTKEINAREYLNKFGFKGKDQQKRVENLSGGEKNRAYLAKLLRRAGNFILLDEPSNDLDITTLRMLENALLDFNGCVMVISHDRFFLDRICTNILAFEGQGKVRYFEGNFKDYEDFRRKELGTDYDKSRKVRYRKLRIK